jgi:glucokinase
MTRTVLGIDIGGTKLAVGVATDDGRLLSTGLVPTFALEGPDAVIRRVVDLANRALADAGLTAADVAGIGVGCTGPLDTVTGIVHDPPNMPGWEVVPVGPRLAEAFGRPVVIDNDANAAALGEYRFGAGRGVSDLFYATISTGIGAGLVLDGRLFRGVNGNAVEIGHMTVAYQGRLCNCGRRGCLEAYASGPAIADRAREALATGDPSTLSAIPGGPDAITAADVSAAAIAGDALAGRVWTETVEVLGAGIANVLNVFNPGRVILGGGVARAGEALFVPVRRMAHEQAFGPLLRVADIVPAELGDQVGVLGAVAIALDQLDAGTRRTAGDR